MMRINKLPAIVEIAVKAGDAYGDSFTLSEGGAALDLAGHGFAGGVTPAAGGAEIPFAIAVEAAEGRVSFGLEAAETAALGPGAHAWRLAWTAPAAGPRTLFQGAFRISP
jgi:hypothetical protein